MSIQNSKKGFTLIELMVVIVIIGILAAIAIPKLFGMSAKAKASEVSPAASTYIKLQQAYTMETSGGPGTADQIGYSLPGTGGVTTNFTYTASTAGAWQATPGGWISSVDNCAASTSTWSVTYASGGTITAVNGCAALTPNFLSLQNN